MFLNYDSSRCKSNSLYITVSMSNRSKMRGIDEGPLLNSLDIHAEMYRNSISLNLGSGMVIVFLIPPMANTKILLVLCSLNLAR